MHQALAGIALAYKRPETGRNHKTAVSDPRFPPNVVGAGRRGITLDKQNNIFPRRLAPNTAVYQVRQTRETCLNAARIRS